MDIAEPEQIDVSCKRWIDEALAADADPQALIGTLLRQGVPLSRIVDTFGDRIPIAGAFPVEAEEPMSFDPPDPIPGCDWAELANPPLLRNPRPQLKAVGGEKLQLYTLDEFMTSEECDRFVAIVNNQLRPSLITRPIGDKDFRTSRSADLRYMQDSFVAEIDERIARTLGIRLSHSEPIEAQRYDVGQQFKHHHDFFQPRTDTYTEFASALGNRTWTFMVYLTDCERGGGTNFPAIERTFQPKKGSAVIWNNLWPNGTPNYDTLHAGEPVLAGHKVIITKWFREKGEGPMFYEAG